MGRRRLPAAFWFPSSASSRPDASNRSSSLEVGPDRRAGPRARGLLLKFRFAVRTCQAERHVESAGSQTAPRPTRRGPRARTPPQRPRERSLRPRPRRSRPHVANRPAADAIYGPRCRVRRSRSPCTRPSSGPSPLSFAGLWHFLSMAWQSTGVTASPAPSGVSLFCGTSLTPDFFLDSVSERKPVSAVTIDRQRLLGTQSLDRLGRMAA
jgi:hypothetical protein